MSVKVINISSKNEPILAFLFPTYSVGSTVPSVSKFIVHRDIRSRAEREALDFRYDDCVFISNQIFDEFWDEEVIIREVIKFSKEKFKNRKTKLEPSEDSFVEDCIKFMYGMSDDESDSSILELFDTFGSGLFTRKFLEISQTTPIPIIVASLNTFIVKLCNPSNSIYYKRKSVLYKDRIEKNFYKALDAFNLRSNDDLGLSWIKFYNDLVC